MRTFTTVLVVILTIILGKFLLSNIDKLFAEILLNIYSVLFICIFSYGVYNIIKYFENE